MGVRPSEIVNVEAGVIHDKAQEVGEDGDEEMETENDENVLPSNVEVFAKKGNTRQERKMSEKKEKEDPLFQLEGNLRMEKASKIIAKKNKKERRRANKLGETLANQMDSAFSALSNNGDE